MNQFLPRDHDRIRFIEAVRKREYLYDRNSPVYKDLELKQRAWEAITVECNIPSVKEARNAWKKMRDNFRDSVRRTLALQNGSTQNFTPYRYHEYMSFLEPFVTSKNFESKTLEILNENEPLVLLSLVDNNFGGDDAGGAYEPQISVDPLSYEPVTEGSGAVNGSGDGDPLAARPAERSSRNNNNKRARSPPTTRPDKKIRLSPDVEIVEGEELNGQQQSSDEDNRAPRASAYSNTNHLDIFFKSMCETTKAMPEKWQLEVKKKIFEVVTCAEESMLKEHEATSRRRLK